jgi:hypothetical protein
MAKTATAFFVLNVAAIVAAIVSGYSMDAITHRFEERQAITFISSNQLGATAMVSWVVYLLGRALRRDPSDVRDASFWAISSVGFLYLTLDETFQFHEGMDTSFLRLFGIEVDPMLDGVPTAIYGIVAAVICYRYRHEITRHSGTLAFFLLGGVFLALTSVLNMGMATSVQIVAEESAKLLGVVSFLLGHLAALAGEIRQVRSSTLPQRAAL